MSLVVEGINIPDSRLAQDITEIVRDTATPLLFHHSSRVYFFGALAGKRRGLKFDPELLYAGANAARDFLKNYNISDADIYTVWTAIALHTTPGIPQYMHPVVALVTAGVEMDVLGLTYPEYGDEERNAVVGAYPRTPQFKEDIIQAFYDGISQCRTRLSSSAARRSSWGFSGGHDYRSP